MAVLQYRTDIVDKYFKNNLICDLRFLFVLGESAILTNVTRRVKMDMLVVWLQIELLIPF